ncbi:hypothetical protein [Microvirga terricola]|uniref:Uncharacterized protein n=1 Tax=Microvirga terricola TaxID=2719797 RepID=A0ABX0V6G8_9HYPH|nr:hypothetical protein [Microvirga terricola]NIX75328.1 hypothetical protein [Microvirga terricola]
MGILSSAEAQTISPEQDSSAHTRFRSFYKSRDVGGLPNLLQDLDRSAGGDWTAHPPIIGFIAGILIENPSRFDLLPNDASTVLQADLALAYSLSGQSERGLAIARQIGLDEKRQAFIRSAPSLKTLTVRNPTELDYLWGAAFATGNPLYIRAIVKRFTQLVDQPEKANDILAISEFMQTKKGDIRWLKERYDRATLLDMALASAILVALSRNVAEHEFIRKVVAEDLPKDGYAHRILTAFSGQGS